MMQLTFADISTGGRFVFSVGGERVCIKIDDATFRYTGDKTYWAADPSDLVRGAVTFAELQAALTFAALKIGEKFRFPPDRSTCVKFTSATYTYFGSMAQSLYAIDPDASVRRA